MGLSVSLTNALSGMNVSQTGLDVVSRNVSNSGTPGYHRQSLEIVSSAGSSSSSAQVSGIQRAFDEALQSRYTDSVSSGSFAAVRADFLTRLESFLSMPGDTGSLDTQFTNFENAWLELETSPDNYAARAAVVTAADSLVHTLNSLTGTVQDLRRETESQIGSEVNRANTILSTLEDVNTQLSDQGMDAGSRATLSDERDRLIAGLSEIIDIQVDYRPNGTVSLMTKSGLGLLDVTASSFEFTGAGNISANSQFDIDDSDNGVGSLYLVSSSGLRVDIVKQGVLQSGTLGALVELRDETFVEVQAQLDEIAASMALSLSTVETAGSAVTVGAADGFDIDLGDVQAGNSFTLSYTESGESKTVKVMRVDDSSKLPLEFTDADGVRVIGLDFSGGIGALATSLGTALGTGLVVSNPSGDVLRIVDDGVAGTTDISGLSARTTVTANQGAGLGINLFMDMGGATFTDSLDGDTQKLGFAGRINVNSAIKSDNELLVQYQSGGSLGDASRATYLVNALQNSVYTTNSTTSPDLSSYVLSGNVQELVAQTLNYQGGAIANAQSAAETQEMMLSAVTDRMDEAYGVDVDSEMARLMELQNAYSANARVVSVVQELLQILMQI